MSCPRHHFVRLHFSLNNVGLQHFINSVPLFGVTLICFHVGLCFFNLAPEFGLFLMEPLIGSLDGRERFLLVLGEIGDVLEPRVQVLIETVSQP